MNNECLYRISEDKIATFLQMEDNDVISKVDIQNQQKCIILLYHNNIIAWKYEASKADRWMCMANFNKYAIDTLNHIKEKCLDALNIQKDTILLQTKKDLENIIIL